MTFTSFDQLLEAVREETPNEGFAAVCSNPPYQIANDSGAASAIYHLFAEASFSICRFASLIYPSRWHSGGGQGDGLGEFRDSQLKSKKYVKFFDFSNSQEFFDNAFIAGGINYFLWDNLKNSGDLEFTHNDETKILKPFLSQYDFLIRSSIENSLIEKISPIKTMADRVYANTFFKVEGAAIKTVKKYENPDGNIKVHFFNERKLKDSTTIESINAIEIEKFKVYLSGTANRTSPSTRARHDRIFMGYKNEISTQSFIRAGDFDTLAEARNCLLYLKTDFVNFLHSILTSTQNSSSRNFSLTPNIDFATGEILDKPGTFLDFSKPEALDDQLAKIYNLTEDERNLMTKDLKPWKDKTSVTADM